MNKNIISVLFFFVLIPVFSWGDNKVSISKIRFIVNGNILTWKVDCELPVNDVHGSTEPKTLLRYFNYKPGDFVNEKDLKREVNKAGLRLKDSNLFYLSSISIIPPKKYPNKRTIVIKVNDGHRFVFGGGAIFGLAGLRNINGRGDSAFITIGLNKANISYVNLSLGNSNFFSTHSVSYNNNFPDYSFQDTSHYGSFSTAIGYRITPDFNLSTKLRYHFNEDMFGLVFRVGYSDKKEFSNISSLGFYTWGNYSISLMDTSSKVESQIKFNYQHNSFSFNLRFGGGSEVYGDYYKKFNLYLNNHISIRSGYSEEQLETEEYLFSSVQINKSFPVVSLPPFFNLETSAFSFADCGFFTGEIYEAYGAGISLYFQSPIFTSFDFSYGWNRNGKGRFIFVSKSFF